MFFGGLLVKYRSWLYNATLMFVSFVFLSATTYTYHGLTYMNTTTMSVIVDPLNTETEISFIFLALAMISMLLGIVFTLFLTQENAEKDIPIVS